MVDAVLVRAAVLYAGIFVAMGVRVPFFPVWLKAEGFDPATIGLALGAASVARIGAVACSAQISDRFQASRGTLIVLTISAVASYAFAGLTLGYWTTLLAAIVAVVMFSPVLPLTDAYALRALGDRGNTFGFARLWGSAAFVVGNLAAGLLLWLVAPRQLIWLVIGVYLAPAVVSIMLPRLERAHPRGSNVLDSLGQPRRLPAAIVAVISASLIQGSHAFYYSFSTLAWLSAGFDTLLISGLWTLGVTAEIVLLAFSRRLLMAFNPTHLLLIGATGATIRWTVMLFDPPLSVLVLMQCLHGASYGATLVGAVHFVGRAASDRSAATAQGFLSISQSLVLAGATSLSGLLFVRYGSLGYGVMGGLAALGGICALIVGYLRSDRTV
jgi:PPP family 3-phenylpropionic acid transporter